LAASPFAELIPLPQLLEQVEAKIPAQRLLDHLTITLARSGGTDLHPAQDVLVNREAGPHLATSASSHQYARAAGALPGAEGPCELLDQLEHSTISWLLEPMMRRSGFEIVRAEHSPEGDFWNDLFRAA